MQYDEHLRKQLRAVCPPDAMKAVLIGDVEGENTRRYPTEGFFSFWDDCILDVPNGLYLIGFFTEKGTPLKTPSLKYLRVQRPQDQCQAPERPHTLSAAHTPPAIMPEHLQELSAVEVNLRAATAEFQKHKMAVAMQKDALGLARATRHTQELQEQAVLNQTYRLEMQAMAETHSNITRRHVEHSQKMIEVLGLTSEMLGSVVSNMQRAASQIGQPPPPPVNYSDAIVKSVGMLGGLALQIIATVKGVAPPKLDEPGEDSVEAGVADKKPPQSEAPAHKSAPPDKAAPLPAIAAKAEKQESEAEAKKASPPSRGTADAQVPTAPANKGSRRDEEKPAPPPNNTEAELQRLVTEFAHEASAAERALPVQEQVTEPPAVEFFLSPQNGQQLDQLVALLNRFKDRRDLDQLIALSAPHLIKRSG